MSDDKGNLPVKITGLGCGGCGVVVGLAGIAAWVAILADEVSRYDRDEWVASAGGMCCTAVLIVMFGGLLVFFGRAKKSKSPQG